MTHDHAIQTSIVHFKLSGQDWVRHTCLICEKFSHNEKELRDFTPRYSPYATM